MTKYRVRRDSDESRIGKGKAKMKGQFLQKWLFTEPRQRQMQGQRKK